MITYDVRIHRAVFIFYYVSESVEDLLGSIVFADGVLQGQDEPIVGVGELKAGVTVLERVGVVDVARAETLPLVALPILVDADMTGKRGHESLASALQITTTFS